MYDEQLSRFWHFIDMHGMRSSRAQDIDIAVCAMIEDYWQSGEPKGDASCLYAAIRDAFIHLSPPMHGSKRLLRAWDKRELPSRAWPFSTTILRGLAGCLEALGHRDFAIGVYVMFHCLLRPGEGLTLRCEQVCFDKGRDTGVLVLRQTKTSQRLNIIESVTFECPIVGRLLKQLCQGKQKGDLLLTGTPYTFRQAFSRALRVLRLDGDRYTPYSLRRGGATHDFRHHGRIERSLIRGRWSSTRSARLYIQEGVATLAEQELDGIDHDLLLAAGRRFTMPLA